MLHCKFMGNLVILNSNNPLYWKHHKPFISEPSTWRWTLGIIIFFEALLKDNVFFHQSEHILKKKQKNKQKLGKLCWEWPENSHFLSSSVPFSVYVDETLACKILQAGNMANAIDEALIFVHLSAIQTHLHSEELFNVAFY